MDQHKREYRKTKRDIKRAGTRKLRQKLKRNLHEAPEDAAHHEVSFGRYRSAELNGNDHDATRRQSDRE